MNTKNTSENSQKGHYSRLVILQHKIWDFKKKSYSDQKDLNLSSRISIWITTI